jgi:hypothetical protein
MPFCRRRLHSSGISKPSPGVFSPRSVCEAVAPPLPPQVDNQVHGHFLQSCVVREPTFQ